ncbi:hypothetical protein HanRHA438_Chr09g0378981 [Helianthus annuus]|uniref:Uncharacterized protein n=1 Tax=Helianthus annuus TaxID=4232 RepID=A0A9K3I2T4_HELAN|nr:hypothetical protein HanXRQr2_Chr09g0367801 [Helianthus annuus]KAJ0532413.1 hypothetical protein HanIR_Chr09g0396531 [Helianthus annuus]KAJ0886401.1 hypothetical protein HanRHA438_Chr09g0378981 [Helianthus annuus]KAJ0891474.1 hypothetical protein HanPSC8_Chr09g0354241 [Helianthus annuus]
MVASRGHLEFRQISSNLFFLFHSVTPKVLFFIFFNIIHIHQAGTTLAYYLRFIGVYTHRVTASPASNMFPIGQ